VVYKLRPATDVARDIELIEDYLYQTYLGFGDDPDSALFRSACRVNDALDYMIAWRFNRTAAPNIQKFDPAYAA